MKNTLIAISADTMGAGDDTLGKLLMKNFIFSITQLEQLPKEMVFYNSGAYLTAEGSDSLEDLLTLEKAGVQIGTCGTCLKTFGIEEKLKVGIVTNMYSILEKQMNAEHVVRP